MKKKHLSVRLCAQSVTPHTVSLTLSACAHSTATFCLLSFVQYEALVISLYKYLAHKKRKRGATAP